MVVMMINDDLPPDNAAQGIFRMRSISSEKRRVPEDVISSPLIKEIARALGAKWPFICSHTPRTNWWGTTKTTKVAFLQASTTLGTATMFSGNLMPCRYLMFSCSRLIMSVKFSPFTFSSNTHWRTEDSNRFPWRWVLVPINFATALPLKKRKAVSTHQPSFLASFFQLNEVHVSCFTSCQSQ